MANVKVKVQRIHPDAHLPVYAHGFEEDAGADLRSVETKTIPAGSSEIFGTGLIVEIPSGMYWALVPRSGLGIKHKITLPNSPATIDPGYRQEVKVALINHGKEDYTVNAGDRIAQAILKVYIPAEYEDGEVSEAIKRQGGFGSSGK